MHSELEATRPYRILVVDDDPVFQQTVKRFLSLHSYEVWLARSTVDAEPLLREQPDLLIVDYRMPGSDGATWIKALRERGVTIPIVFCTASTYTSQFHANLRNVLKVDLIIRKPIVESDFIMLMQSLLPRLDEIHEEQWISDSESLMTDFVAQMFEEEREKDENHVNDYGEASAPQCPRTPIDSAVAARLKTTEAVRDLATLYLSELPAISKLLREELIDSREHNVLSLLETAAAQAHLMSGASGTLGFLEIHRIAQQLEECLQDAAAPDRSGDPLNYSLFVDLLDSLDLAIKTATEEDCGQVTVEPPDVMLTHGGESFKSEMQNMPVSPMYSVSPMTPVTSITPISSVTHTTHTTPTTPDTSRAAAALRFLILSDNFEESAILSSILADFQSAQTKCLEEGLAVFPILAEYRPDLLFIDAGLAGQSSAYDICRMIRCNHLWDQVKIIFTLDVFASDCRLQIFECGGDDFVLLPINKGELLKRVSHLLGPASQS